MKENEKETLAFSIDIHIFVASDGAKVDALVMATTANLTAMSKQSVSRSWNSFRHENLEEKMAADKKERENPSKSRTVSRYLLSRLIFCIF